MCKYIISPKSEKPKYGLASETKKQTILLRDSLFFYCFNEKHYTKSYAIRAAASL